ncbi:MAG: hypothetical protein ACLRWQ_10365 [Flavonifractor plautii]
MPYCHLGQLIPCRGTVPATTSLNFLGQYLACGCAGIEGTRLWRVPLWAAAGGSCPPSRFAGYTRRGGPVPTAIWRPTTSPPRIDGTISRLQYNNLFGGEDRLAAFFDPESGGATGG